MDAVDGARRSPGVTSMIALQRSVGNASTVALMRTAHEAADEAPVTLTIPEVVDRASVSSWNLEYDGHHNLVGLRLTRPMDENSPRLARATTTGWPGDATATFLVRKLTPLGWIRVLTITMDGCMVSSYSPGGDYESVGLTFTRARLDQDGVSP
jgi:type VI protein secretion system component Hcp